MSLARDIADLGSSATRLDTVGSNLIINGGMQIAQRSTSSTATGYKTVDRFSFNASGFDEAAFTQAQSSLAPSGFINSFRVDCTTVESALASNEYANVAHVIEAQNLQHIQNGSSDAKSLTLSFWVKSNKTGTYGICLYKGDNTGRQITATYSISSADTWEYQKITLVGDTSGGGIDNNNGAGFYLYFHLAAGSGQTSQDTTSWTNYADTGFAYGHTVNIFDNTANDWAVTGVQLEVGDTATDFEHRSYGDQLQRCLRYFQRYEFAHGSMQVAVQSSTTAGYAGFDYSPKRANPTITMPTTDDAAAANSIFLLTSSGGLRSNNSAGTAAADKIGIYRCRLKMTGFAASGAIGDATWIYYATNGSADPHIFVDAEL